MRLARIIGQVTLHRQLEELPIGSLLICEPLDPSGVRNLDRDQRRNTPTDQSLVAFDELGAGEDCIVAVAEGREASMPWWPEHKPVDAYCVAILDQLNVNHELMSS